MAPPTRPQGREGQEAREGAFQAAACRWVVEGLQHRRSGHIAASRKADLRALTGTPVAPANASEASEPRDALASRPSFTHFSGMGNVRRGVRSIHTGGDQHGHGRAAGGQRAGVPARSPRPRARRSGSKPSFMRELFLGNFRLDLIHPFPLPGHERPEFSAFYAKLHASCATRWTRPRSTAPASTRSSVLDGLRRLGAFGMKIPREVRRARLHERRVQPGDEADREPLRQPRRAALRAPVDRRAAAAQAVRQRGAEEEVPAPLRRAARSRPSRSPSRTSAPTPRACSTTAEKTPDGDAYVLNGTEALVHERHDRQAAGGDGRSIPARRKISAFVVETDWPGVQRRAPLPLHGPAGALQRGDRVQGRARPARRT